MNLVVITGRLGQDPEVKQTSGDKVANFSIATSEYWTDKQGQRQEKTEWHSIVCWGKKADLIEKYVKKGSRLSVVGKLKTRSWDDPNSGEKKYKTEIDISYGELEFLDSKSSEESKPSNTKDDLPF